MNRGSDCPCWNEEKQRKMPCGVCEWCKFRLALTGLFAGYPTAKMSEFTIGSYWERLKRFDWPVVRQALLDVAGDSLDFPPSVARCLETAESVQRRTKPAFQALPPPPDSDRDSSKQHIREILASLSGKMELR